MSSTLLDPGWTNSTVLTGDVVNEVTKLKERLDGEIVLNGSGRLARTLIEHHLVDELRLMVYPFVLGSGERLFPETDDRTVDAADRAPGPSATASPSSPTTSCVPPSPYLNA